MAQLQATENPRKSAVAHNDVTPFGIVKKIRYMVNSTPEFIEILHGVNQMFALVEDVEENKTLQQSCQIDVMPLPHSESKFIVSFLIPSDLLGVGSSRRQRKIDFAEFYDPKDKPQIVKKPPKMFFSYDIDSLFDLNLAFYNFQATLAPSVPTPQWSRVRRSIEIIARPRQSPEDRLKFVFIAQITTSVQA